ncbi:hypothetical protein C2G38_2106685, partial [Gigaspora rosea]
MSVRTFPSLNKRYNYLSFISCFPPCLTFAAVIISTIILPESVNPRTVPLRLFAIKLLAHTIVCITWYSKGPVCWSVFLL